MPKEVVAPVPNADLVVEVAWGRDTSVQLASVNLCRQQYQEARGWFVEMDRTAINRLIRTLRKARDQAFGVDE